MRRIALALGALSIASLAYAQEAPKPTTESEAPAVTTPDSTNPAAPVAGENSFTEAQAQERIEAKGYTAVTGLVKGEDGIWTGTGTKDGKSFEVKLDYQGNITETAK